MSEQPIYPDVVGIVRDFLLEHLDVPVTIEMTKQDTEVSKRHVAFVRLNLFGGVDATVVSGRPRMGAEAWAETNVAAYDLAQEVVAILRHLPDERGPVFKMTVPSLPGNLPDPLSDHSRFVFQFEPHVRAEAHTLAGS